MSSQARSLLSLVAATFVWLADVALAAPYPFQYSGRLTEITGKPVAGPIDLAVKFYRVSQGGSEVSVTVPDFLDVPLQFGLFVIDLNLSANDFSVLFDGSQEVWIEVTDITHGRTYPRQRFGAVPYALRVPVDGTSIVVNSSGELEVASVSHAAHATDADHATAADSATTAGQIHSIPIQSGTPSDGKILKYSNSNGRWEFADDASTPGSGEANTGSSLGGTAAVYKSKNLFDLQFRGLSAGSGATVTQNANDITIAANVTMVAGRTGSVTLDADDVAATFGKKWLTLAEQTKLAGISDGADVTNATSVDVAGAVMNTDFSSNGIMTRTGAGAYGSLTDNSANWNTAYGWGNHGTAGYLKNSDFGSNGIMTRTGAGTYGVVTDNSANWSTAYGWGNHAAAGYLTSVPWAAPGTVGSTTPNTGTFTTLQANSSVRVKDGDTNYVQVQSPANLAANYTLTLPANDGNNLDVLQTNGSGALTWVAIPSAPVQTVASRSGNVTLDAADIAPTSTRLWLSNTDKANYDAAYGWGNHAAANYVADADFTANGLMKRTAAGTYTSVTDNSTNWDAAHTDRLKWDGGATGLTAATGRTSLGLGTMATQNAGTVTITGGTISTSSLTVANGSQGAGKVLTSDANGLGSWQVVTLADYPTVVTAAISVTAGEMYYFDLNAAAGDVAATLPASPAAGDMVGLYLASHDGTHARKVTINLNGKKIESLTDAGDYSLFAQGDLLVLRYTTVGSGAIGWRPERQQLKPHFALTGGSMSVADSTDVWPGDLTEEQDPLHMADLANDRIEIRRSGRYNGCISQTTVGAVLDAGEFVDPALRLDGNQLFNVIDASGGPNGYVWAARCETFYANRGQMVTIKVKQTEGTTQSVLYQLSVQEQSR